MLTLALFAMVAAADQPIIVTAERKTQEALAECLARQCSVREDAIASIKHAQAQFAAGDYPEARIALRAALDRHEDAADTDPRAVSALWYALGRATLHNGDLVEYRKAAMRAGSILEGAPALTQSERVLGGTQIADALLLTGDPLAAARRYQSMETEARERGDERVAQLLNLRAIHARSYWSGKATQKRAIKRLLASQKLAPSAELLALSLAARLETNENAAAALLDRVPVQSANAPVQMIWKGKSRLRESEDLDRTDDGSHYSWADIGFWIRPNGRVESAEILRRSAAKGWNEGMLAQVQQRRYAPFQADIGDRGHYKIERVTFVREYITPLGSLIRRPAGAPSFRWEEMKIEQAGAAPGTPAGPLY